MPVSHLHPQLKEAAHLLRSSHERKQSRRTVLEGEHLVVLYAQQCGAPLMLVVSQKYEAHPLAKKFGQHLLIADDAWFSKNAPTSAGMVAVIDEPISTERRGHFCVLLDDVQDPGNAGSILRTAAAAGCSDVIFSEKSVSAWSPKTLRAAQGAHFLLNIIEEVDLVAFAHHFRAQKGALIAALPSGGTPLYHAPLIASEDVPLGVIVGNEGAGISLPLVSLADHRVTIPMPGGMESLNVGIAAAIVLFECVRLRSFTR
ncbi:MAG: RNA methyltransferase [Burkholderiales bacterium]|jgi:TrmH family RNA methyltransferase|nr:RNA methyltransferase [Burkholderiales bacterium]